MFTHVFKGLKAAVKLVAVVAVVAFQGCTTAPEAEKPLRVAVFVGAGARNVGAFRWLQITTFAKDMESIPVDGASIRNGALDGVDVLVMPGGWSGGDLLRQGRQQRHYRADAPPCA